MRSIDLRRHVQRDPGGVHLNATGLALARRLGAESGRFDRAVTSTIPRAIETAEGMGASPVETREELGRFPLPVEAAVGPIVHWSDYAEAARRSPEVAQFAELQRRLLEEIARALPEEGRALVVSHGAIVELAAVGALPESDATRWGGPAGYGEGMRLVFDGRRFAEGAVLRVSASG